MTTKKSLRLDGIDPTDLATATLHEAMSRVCNILTAIAPFGSFAILNNGKPLDVSNVGSSVAGLSVQMLASYAKTGAPLEEGVSVEDHCVSLIPVAPDALDDALATYPESELGLVISAALGRQAIKSGHRISTTRLAQLASLAPSRVRQLVTEGELKVDKSNEIAASVAERWLEARGVAGFGRRA